MDNNGYYYENGNAPFNKQGAYTGSPQFNYNYQPPRQAPSDPFINREARHLAKLGILAGAAILSFIGMQNIMALLLKWLGLSELYISNYSFQMIFSTFCSIICIFVPFIAVYVLYPSGDKAMCFDFGKPISKKAFFLALGAGAMICLMGDYVASGFTSFAGRFGVSFTDIDTKAPSSIPEFLIYTLECAVVPALVEEFAVRGVIMQPLRRYGDRFAIVMSALIFALMHGNMLQIPVALVAGISLGYFAIATKSIWTSVAIHFTNNLLAVILTTGGNNAIVGILFSLASMAIVIGGIICLVKFISTEHEGLGFTFAPKEEKTLLVIFSVLFIVFSYLSTIFQRTIALIYLGFVVALAVVIYAYITSNKKMLGKNTDRGLSNKLMASIYIATPTVILAFYSLTLMTFEMISFEGLGSYIFCFMLFALYFAFSIYTVMNVKKSKLIEYKKPYSISVISLVLLAVFTVILLFVS